MSYLIDASNLGGALGGGRGARDPEAVVRFLSGWARSRARVVVVFDGPASMRVAERYGAMQIVWSGTRSADDVIAERVRAEPRAWTVVTDDQELRARCRDLGGRAEPAATLIERVLAPHPRAPKRGAPAAASEQKPQQSAAELRHWRAVFGDEET